MSPTATRPSVFFHAGSFGYPGDSLDPPFADCSGSFAGALISAIRTASVDVHYDDLSSRLVVLSVA